MVVTRLDHDANIRPWVQAAEAAGARCGGRSSTRETGDLPVDRGRRSRAARTRLVAVHRRLQPARHPPRRRRDRGRGPRGGCAAVRRRRPSDPARPGRRERRSAPTSTPARRTSSSARTSGPSSPTHDLLKTLEPDKLVPSTDAVPERFELGTLPYELLAGTSATVDFIAGLLPDGAATRGARRCWPRWRTVEDARGPAVRPAARRAGEPRRRDGCTAGRRTGRRPRFSRWRAGPGGGLRSGWLRAGQRTRRELLRDRGFTLGRSRRHRRRARGLAPYTDDDDVDRLLAGVADLCR